MFKQSSSERWVKTSHALGLLVDLDHSGKLPDGKRPWALYVGYKPVSPLGSVYMCSLHQVRILLQRVVTNTRIVTVLATLMLDLEETRVLYCCSHYLQNNYTRIPQMARSTNSMFERLLLATADATTVER